MRRCLFLSSAAVVLSFGIGHAAAQEYPSKPITIVIPQGPGGASDLLPRALAPALSKILGQPVVVENRTSANNLIGYEYVAKQAPADGYTLLQITDTTHPILPLIFKDMRFSPLQDLTPLGFLADSRLLLSSSIQEPWQNLKEMAAYAKGNPGKLNFSSSSASTRLQTAWVARTLGIDIVYVPYKSTNAGTTAIISRETNMGMMNEAQAVSLRDRLRVLAASGDKRSPAFPDVPTFEEQGVPQMKNFTIGLAVRTGTPRAIIDKFYAAVDQAMKQPEMRGVFSKLEVEPVNMPPQAAAQHLAQRARFFAEIAKQIGLQPE
jgi:tripartite-type tricarboxylate transporter receptor subunit TctC